MCRQQRLFFVYRIIRLIGKKPLVRKEGKRKWWSAVVLDSAFKLCGKWSNRRSPPTHATRPNWQTPHLHIQNAPHSFLERLHNREKRKLRKISSRFPLLFCFWSLRVTFFLLAIGFYDFTKFALSSSAVMTRDTRFGMQGFPFFLVNLLIGKQARDRENGRRERRYL